VFAHQDDGQRVRTRLWGVAGPNRSLYALEAGNERSEPAVVPDSLGLGPEISHSPGPSQVHRHCLDRWMGADNRLSF
jgi:hypothetical protein